MKVASDQAFPRLQQISFFLPNKVGTLQRVVDVLERNDLAIRAVSILDAHDHAVVRMIVDLPDKARERLQEAGHDTLVTNLIGIALPADEERGIGFVLATLLRAELNVHYTYSLFGQHHGKSVIAIHIDDLPTAVQTLRRAGMELVDQRDLEKP